MILQIIILLLALPTGYLIAWLCRDELVQGRKWFRILIICAVVTAIGFFLFGNRIISLTSLFIVIVSTISYIKSFDKKWLKKLKFSS